MPPPPHRQPPPLRAGGRSGRGQRPRRGRASWGLAARRCPDGLPAEGTAARGLSCRRRTPGRRREAELGPNAAPKLLRFQPGGRDAVAGVVSGSPQEAGAGPGPVAAASRPLPLRRRWALHSLGTTSERLSRWEQPQSTHGESFATPKCIWVKAPHGFLFGKNLTACPASVALPGPRSSFLPFFFRGVSVFTQSELSPSPSPGCA